MKISKKRFPFLEPNFKGKTLGITFRDDTTNQPSELNGFIEQMFAVTKGVVPSIVSANMFGFYNQILDSNKNTIIKLSRNLFDKTLTKILMFGNTYCVIDISAENQVCNILVTKENGLVFAADIKFGKDKDAITSSHYYKNTNYSADECHSHIVHYVMLYMFLKHLEVKEIGIQPNRKNQETKKSGYKIINNSTVPIRYIKADFHMSRLIASTIRVGHFRLQNYKDHKKLIWIAQTKVKAYKKRASSEIKSI